MSKKLPAHEVILQELQDMLRVYDKLEKSAFSYRCDRKTRFNIELDAKKYFEFLTKIFIPKNARAKVVEELRKLPGAFFSPAERFPSGSLPSQAESIFKKILKE